MPKKQVSQDRKARVAEMQQKEKARENRVRIQIIAAAAALLLVLGAAISYAVIDAGKKQPDVAITAIGVPASAAAGTPGPTDTAGADSNPVGPRPTTPHPSRSRSVGRSTQ